MVFRSLKKISLFGEHGIKLETLFRNTYEKQPIHLNNAIALR